MQKFRQILRARGPAVESRSNCGDNQGDLLPAAFWIRITHKPFKSTDFQTPFVPYLTKLSGDPCCKTKLWIQPLGDWLFRGGPAWSRLAKRLWSGNKHEAVHSWSKESASGERRIRWIGTQFGGSEVGLTLVAWKRVKEVGMPGLSAEEEMVQDEAGWVGC